MTDSIEQCGFLRSRTVCFAVLVRRVDHEFALLSRFHGELIGPLVAGLAGMTLDPDERYLIPAL